MCLVGGGRVGVKGAKHDAVINFFTMAILTRQFERTCLVTRAVKGVEPLRKREGIILRKKTLTNKKKQFEGSFVHCELSTIFTTIELKMGGKLSQKYFKL